MSYFYRKRFESPLWQWCKEHDKTEDFIWVCNLRDSETVANIALIMLHQTDLLRKLIDKFKSDFLTQVFAGNTGTSIAPTPEEVEGFNKYIEAYKKGLEIEKMAVERK